MLGLLAALVPKAIDLFVGEDSKAAKAIGIATDIAETLTGKTGDEAVAAINADPALQLEFKKAIMADSHIESEMRYKDRENARAMFMHNNEMQLKIAEKIMTWNLPYIFALIMVNAALFVLVPVEYSAAAQAAATIIGMVIQSLLKERQDLVGFSFGSSAGSKNKD